MVIGINLLYLFPDAVGGTETYARGLIDGLKKIDNKNQYFLFCNKECAPTFRGSANVKVVELPVSATNRVIRSLFELIVFPFYLRKFNIDIVHSLGYTSPIISPCPTVVNIYDLNWYFHPEDFTRFRRIGWKFFVTISAKFCTGIITSSNSSKKHLKRIMKLNPEKINVVYGGTPHLEKSLSKRSLAKFGITSKYIFTLTADIPHKNIIGLLKAISFLERSGKKYTLVIGGLKGKMRKVATSYINNHNLAHKIIILGWLEPRELTTLYKYASVFVIPSLHEGFGFPVVEAFSIGTPLVSSKAFSLREVVGKAGLLFNPRKPSEIAEKIVEVMGNPRLARKLIRLGRKRVKEFSWEKSAKATLGIYNSILKNE